MITSFEKPCPTDPNELKGLLINGCVDYIEEKHSNGELDRYTYIDIEPDPDGTYFDTLVNVVDDEGFPSQFPLTSLCHIAHVINLVGHFED